MLHVEEVKELYEISKAWSINNFIEEFRGVVGIFQYTAALTSN